MKPILFDTQMVRAMMREDNPKTQTRRVIDPQPTENTSYAGLVKSSENAALVGCGVFSFGDGTAEYIRARYQPGNIVYVRETWQYGTELFGVFPQPIYKADFTEAELEEVKKKHFRWRPSIHMPREAARLFLRVTGVRAERLQDISEEDARAEGVRSYFLHKEHGGEWHESNCAFVGVDDTHPTRRDAFATLWDSLCSKRGRGWDTNPWVWVYTFERIDKEEAVRE